MLDKKTIFMQHIAGLIEKVLTDDKSEFKYWFMNFLGYRLFQVDKEIYTAFCLSFGDDMQFVEESYMPKLWVYDPDEPKGTFSDKSGKPEHIGYGVEL